MRTRHGQHDADVIGLLDRARVDDPTLDRLPHECEGVRLLGALCEPEQDAEERPGEQRDPVRGPCRLVLERVRPAHVLPQHLGQPLVQQEKELAERGAVDVARAQDAHRDLDGGREPDLVQAAVRAQRAHEHEHVPLREEPPRAELLEQEHGGVPEAVRAHAQDVRRVRDELLHHVVALALHGVPDDVAVGGRGDVHEGVGPVRPAGGEVCGDVLAPVCGAFHWGSVALGVWCGIGVLGCGLVLAGVRLLDLGGLLSGLSVIWGLWRPQFDPRLRLGRLCG